MRTFEILDSLETRKNFKSSHPKKPNERNYTTKNIKFQLTKRKPKRTNKISAGKPVYNKGSELWLFYHLQIIRRK